MKNILEVRGTKEFHLCKFDKDDFRIILIEENKFGSVTLAVTDSEDKMISLYREIIFRFCL